MNARALLRNRDVSRLLGAQLLSTLTFGVVAAALGWQAYERTGSPLTLGLIGLAEFLPALIFALPAGQMADRLDRRLVTALGMEELGPDDEEEEGEEDHGNGLF